MSVPSTFAKGCSFDRNYGGCSTTTLLKLHVIHSDVATCSVKNARGANDAVKKDSIPYEHSHSLYAQSNHGPKIDRICMTGTQIQLVDSLVCKTLSRKASTHDIQSTEFGVLNSDIKSSTHLGNLTSSFVAQCQCQTQPAAVSCGEVRFEDGPLVSMLNESQMSNRTLTQSLISGKNGDEQQLVFPESTAGSEVCPHKTKKKRRKQKRKSSKSKKSIERLRHPDSGIKLDELRPIQAMCVSMNLKPIPPSHSKPRVQQPALAARYHPTALQQKAVTTLSLYKRSKHPRASGRKSADGGCKISSAPQMSQVSASCGMPRMTKVYQSDRQSKNMQQLGVEFPCPPPCTPLPDFMKTVKYIPSMSNIRAQRALRVRLESMERVQHQRRQKQRETELKLQKKQQQEHLTELRRRQRKEIYALNKVMTELENKNFEAFMKQQKSKEL